jgi:Uncharacterized conserved protein, COG3350
MARDIVCGMYVDESSAEFKVSKGGVLYYFCSQSCMLQFLEPEIELRRLKRMVAFASPQVPYRRLRVPPSVPPDAPPDAWSCWLCDRGPVLGRPPVYRAS